MTEPILLCFRVAPIETAVSRYKSAPFIEFIIRTIKIGIRIHIGIKDKNAASISPKTIPMTKTITTIINNLGDFALKMFDKLKIMFTRPKRAGMSFTRGGAKHSADHEYNARKKENEAAINHILEKIKKSGYSALSDEEKKRLFDASDK